MSVWNELWNNKDFIRKRIREQLVYLINLQYKYERGIVAKERYDELFESALSVQFKLEQQMANLLIYGNNTNKD